MSKMAKEKNLMDENGDEEDVSLRISPCDFARRNCAGYNPEFCSTETDVEFCGHAQEGQLITNGECPFVI